MPNPGPATTISANYIGGGNAPDGTDIGNNSQSKVSFYGVSPAAVQRSGGTQAAIGSTPLSGVLVALTVTAVYPQSGTISATTISPMNVVFQSAAFVSTTDVVIVNKLLPQAGMGILQARVSTVSNVLVQYINMTNSNVTTTVTENIIAAAFRGLDQTVTLTPPVIAANSIQEAQFTVTGLVPAQLVYVVKPTDQLGLGIVNARVPANNTLALSFINNLSTQITPTAAEGYRIVALDGLVATNSMMVAKIVTPPAALATITGVTTRTITVTGFAITDDIISAQRTLSQQDLALVAANVNAANQLSLQYVNSGQTASPVTPTTGELYTIAFQRPQTAPPLIVQSVTLTPTIIGALTTAEVTFAVSNITVSTVVWVNKPSFTTGIGVVGMRAVSTNVIGITYVNNTAVSITPPAEAYLVGNIPTILGVGHQVQSQVMTSLQSNTDLTNEIRAALVGMGIIAGS